MCSSSPYARLIARAMMSLTTSLGRPFSAESCASPVPSSRFIARSPLHSVSGAGSKAALGRKKSGVDPLLCPPRRPERPDANDNYSKREKLASARSGLAAAPLLRKVISDAREVIRELIAEKDHRDDYRYRDSRDDECVLDYPLSFLVPAKLDHARSFYGAAAA